MNEIRALLDFYGAAGDGPASGLGCLLCNTAIEFGPTDPSGAGFTRRYFERLSSAFANALSNAKERGEVDPNVDVGTEAQFFTASLLGMFVMLRATAPATAVESAAAAAIKHLEALTPSGSERNVSS